MATWRSLTNEEREDALSAVARGDDPEDVARRLGIKASSFKRKLRRLREKGEAPPRPTTRRNDGDQITKTEHLNTATILSRSPRILTLEQLLKVTETDLDVWRVDHHLINKWEVGAKCEYKDLTWNAGVMDGTVKADGLTVEPLIQIKAWLVRREPIPIFPIVQPVESPWTLAEFARAAVGEREPPRREGIQRSFIWADAQVGFRKDLRTAKLEPFHDRRAMDVALQVMEAAQPDRVDGLGDSGDFAMWTDKYVRDPEFKYTTQPMLCELHWWLAQMRVLLGYDVPVKLHQGNHEVRVDDQLKTHLHEGHDLRAVDEMELPPAMSVQKLLALHELGIEWVGDYPDDEDWLSPNVCVSHGDTARSPGNTAKTVVGETDCIRIIGHVHRSEMAIRAIHTRDGDKVALCCCVPCLCHADGRVPGSDKREQWQQGVTIVDYEVEGRGYNITHVPIEDGRAIWDGQLFVGRDRVEEIAEAWPGWNW